MLIYTAFLGSFTFGTGLSYSFSHKNIIQPGSSLDNKVIRIHRININTFWYTDILPLPTVEYCMRVGGFAVDRQQGLIANVGGDVNIDSVLAYKNLGQFQGGDHQSFDLDRSGFLVKDTSNGIYMNFQVSSWDNQVISFSGTTGLNCAVQILYEREVI